MRISDWSSDVCSSDLHVDPDSRRQPRAVADLPGDAVVRLVPDGVAVETDHVDLARRQPGTVEQQQHRRGVPFGELGLDTVHIAALAQDRSGEHTSELQSLMRISYAVFSLTKNTE